MSARDAAFEDAFLADMEEVVKQVRGLAYDGRQTIPFRRMLAERLAMGEERYGDLWTGRDNLTEAAEEKPDAVAYYMLELQRQLGAGADEQVIAGARVKLVVAAAHLAIADDLARAAQRELSSP